jgi:hypothetical protein
MCRATIARQRHVSGIMELGTEDASCATSRIQTGCTGRQQQMCSPPAGTQPASVEHSNHDDGGGAASGRGEAAATADAAAAAQGPTEQPQHQQQGRTSAAQLDGDRQEGASYSDDDNFAAAGPAYADEGPSSRGHYDGSAAPAADQRPFDDDAWDLGQRFREPHSEEAGAAPAEASADAPEGQHPGADTAPPEVVLTPEEVEVNVRSIATEVQTPAYELHESLGRRWGLPAFFAQERTATAEALKQEGNSLYSEGKHAEAQVTC